MEETRYWRKIRRDSPFVIVAPHGSDDLFTIEIAEALARTLGASAISNAKFVKPSNALAEAGYADVRDFNTLPWYADDGAYVRNIENEGLRDFIRDLMGFTRYVAVERWDVPVIVYVHGLKDRWDVGFDIGIGVRLRETGLSTAKEYAEVFLSDENVAPWGSVIADVRKTVRIKSFWNAKLMDERGFTAKIWDKYFTGRPEQTPQIHKNLGYRSESIQIEINRTLREDREYVVPLLAQWLELVFGKTAA